MFPPWITWMFYPLSGFKCVCMQIHVEAKGETTGGTGWAHTSSGVGRDVSGIFWSQGKGKSRTSAMRHKAKWGRLKTQCSIRKVPSGLENLFGRHILKRMRSLLGSEFCLISKETFLIFKKIFKKRACNPQCLRFMFSKCGPRFLHVLDIFLMGYKYLKCVNTMGGWVF